MSEAAGEKTFAPSAKRKRDAAQRGDVVRSKELTTAVTVLIGAAWLRFAGPWVFGKLAASVRGGFIWDRTTIEDFAPQQMLLAALIAAMPPVLVLGGGVMFSAVALQLTLGEGRWVPGNLAPKASRLNPLAGLGKVFGPQGWIELGKGLLKLTLLGSMLYVWARPRLTTMVGLGTGTLAGELAMAFDMLTSLAFTMAAGLMAIAMLDVPVQLVRRFMRLRMSRQEMRDEGKESEGSPETKQAQRNRARQLSRGGVQRAMQEAQFLITNPSHFAVAMSYDPDKAPAPVVLAKGRGDKALAMRDLAAELGLPTLEIPPLARSVYFTTRENQMIREELYAAIASVLAFVLSLKRGDAPPLPHVDVPQTLRFDAEGRPEARMASPVDR
jgi:flagellar biosynthetic protein FlhB